MLPSISSGIEFIGDEDFPRDLDFLPGKNPFSRNGEPALMIAEDNQIAAVGVGGLYAEDDPISDEGGLVMYDGARWHNWATVDSLSPHHELRSFKKDANGSIWMGSGGGLLKFDGSAFTVYNRSTVPGFPCDTVHDVDIDPSGNIWFAMDGAQAPVCVPFDIVETGVDFYTSSTHKWLMGPKCTGFLYVRQGMLDSVRPVTVGAYSSERNEIGKMDLALHPTAQRYEYGTQNDALFFALGAAIDFVQTIGMPRIWQHNHALAERFHRGLQAIPGAEILSPREEAYRTAMISFRMKDRTYQQINEHLAKARIRVRPVRKAAATASASRSTSATTSPRSTRS